MIFIHLTIQIIFISFIIIILTTHNYLLNAPGFIYDSLFGKKFVEPQQRFWYTQQESSI